MSTVLFKTFLYVNIISILKYHYEDNYVIKLLFLYIY